MSHLVHAAGRALLVGGLAAGVSLAGCSRWVAVDKRHAHRYDGVTRESDGLRVTYDADPNYVSTIGRAGIAPEANSSAQGQRKVAGRAREPGMSFVEPASAVKRVKLRGADGEPLELMKGRDVRIRTGERVLELQHPLRLEWDEGGLIVADADQPETRLALSDIDAVEVNQPPDMPWFPLVAVGGSIALVVALVALGP